MATETVAFRFTGTALGARCEAQLSKNRLGVPHRKGKGSPAAGRSFGVGRQIIHDDPELSATRDETPAAESSGQCAQAREGESGRDPPDNLTTADDKKCCKELLVSCSAPPPSGSCLPPSMLRLRSVPLLAAAAAGC